MLQTLPLRSRSKKLSLAGLLLLVPGAVACGSQGDPAQPSAGAPAALGGGASSAPLGMAGSAATSGGAAPASAGAGGVPAVGASGTASGAATAAVGGAGGAGGAPMVHDHCLYGYDPQPTDETMKDGPAEYYAAGKTDAATVDLTVQPEVLSWMQAHYWEATHVEWHAIRTCSLPGGPRGSMVNICQYTEMIPTDQTCQTAGDGYQFMLFHRHMLESLKQLWPKHSEQFTGFPKFPQSAADVPAQWRAAWKVFNATDLANAKIADEIDKPENLAMFPDEGALGFWFQCGMGTKINGFNLSSSGLHGDLHGHWIRQGNTDHGVGNTSANIDNYMFWKLHGWMDSVWEKYRLAKGIQRTDPKYVADMLAQCREMDIEEEICRTGTKPVDTSAPLPVESGFFHEKVRPIFESAANKCSGCHSASGPEAAMSLGGHISSKDIVANLVNKQAVDGGQYKRIVPGHPEQSWLYLKISAMTDSCTPSNDGLCVGGPMPPSSDGMPSVSADDLATVRQWIMDGATGPQ